MIKYVFSSEGVTLHQLRGFFEGWLQPPSPETQLRLENSDEVVLAVDDETGDYEWF